MKTTSSDELSAKQKAFVIKVLRDPVLFANHILGLRLWEREAEILRSIKTHRRTAVKACHGVGKTFTLAVGTLWWLARYDKGIVLTTSPTQRQVRTQLWSEIHRLVESAKVPYPKLNTTELKFRDDNNFAIGFSTNQAENFQGYHGKYVLIIADEAPGIESGIWDAVAGIMAGGKVHVVMAGNPTIPSGAFFDTFTKERGLWNCFTIDAFDSPNLKGLTLEQLLLLDPAEGGPLDRNPFPLPDYETLGLRPALGLVARQRQQLAKLVVTRAGPLSGSGSERAHQNDLAGAGQAARPARPGRRSRVWSSSRRGRRRWRRSGDRRVRVRVQAQST
jgi:hypothetical protein